MYLIQNATGAGEFKQLPPGRWKVTADIGASNAAVVTFHEKYSTSGTAIPVNDAAGDPISLADPGGAFEYESSWHWLRATSTGGTAVTVRAEPLPTV